MRDLLRQIGVGAIVTKLPTGVRLLLMLTWGIDGACGQEIIKMVPVGISPAAAIISPDGRSVYVTNNGANSVSVIDIARNEVSKTIIVGGHPYGIAATPNGAKVYVTNTEGNTISVIKSESDQVSKTIAVLDGQSPTYIAVTPEGDKAYVSNIYGVVQRFSGNINVIDLKTDEVVSKIGSAAKFGVRRIGCPEGIATFPKISRRLAYLNTQCTATNLSRNHDPIFVIDTDSDLIVGAIDFSQYPNVGSGIAVSPDGKTVWASGANACGVPPAVHKGCAPGANNPVTVIDPETNTIKKQLFFGGPQFITFSPSGRKVYLATDSAILLFDVAAVAATAEFQLTEQNLRAQGRITTAGSTGSLAFTRSADYAYAPISGQNSVAVIKLGDQWR